MHKHRARRFEVLPCDDEEIARLAERGLTFDEHTWMLDPEGNDFRVTDVQERA